MVRSASLSALAESLPPGVTIPHHRALVLQLASAAKSDQAAAVRSTAARALGMLGTQPWLLIGNNTVHQGEEQSGTEPSLACLAVDSLLHCLSDSVLSVRISASQAIANICDAASTLLRCPTRLLLPPSPDSTAASQQSRQPGGNSFVVLMEKLMEATRLASRDVDKVRSNGVRGMGSLMASLSTGSPSSESGHLTSDRHIEARRGQGQGGGSTGPLLSVPAPSPEAISSWLERALPNLQSCLTTGNMKAQWDAASALQGLLSNSSILGPSSASRTAPLLLLLVMLVRDSPNSKVRMHAAAALAALASRAAYGDVYSDALTVICGAIDGQQQQQQQQQQPATDDGAATGGGSSPVPPLPLTAPSVESFPNYRYAAGLSSQLAHMLIHLLGLAAPSDGARLRDILVKRTDALRRVLLTAAEEAVLSSELWALVTSSPGPPVGALPSDPFDLSRGDERDLAASRAEPPIGGGGGVGAAQTRIDFIPSLEAAVDAAAMLATSAGARPDTSGTVEWDRLDEISRALRGLGVLLQQQQQLHHKQKIVSVGGKSLSGNTKEGLQEVAEVAELIDAWSRLHAQGLGEH